MAMKRFLLFLLINLPILGHTQSWSGDLDKFESSGEYWMLDGEKMTETLSLEQAYTLPAGTENWEWEFGLYFKTKPTNSNCITVYPVKGADIYFQAGKNGYNDLFQFSVNGKEETFTFSFTEYEYKETEMSVRISLTDGDQWHIALVLQDRLNGRSERQSGQIEGKVDLPESAHFRYEVKHTKSNPKSLGVSQKIIMTEGQPSEPGEKPEEPDSSLITCLYIEPLSEDEVLYKFTDEVDKSYAAFSISGKGFDGKTEAVKEIYDDNDYSVIKVRFPNAMTLDEEYTFYWEKVKDPKGLPVKDGSLHGIFSFKDEEENPDPEEPDRPADSFSSGDIRINEVMANPIGFEPEIEYVELYNTLDKDITLDGWIFDYGDGYRQCALDGIVISACGYLVLYHAQYDWELPENMACPIDKFPSLANGGKTIALFYGAEMIDRYEYPEAEEGISREYGAEGWHLCSDDRGGTPGLLNSDGMTDEVPDDEEPEQPEEEEPDKPVSPTESYSYRDIRITEIMADPKGFEPETEYIELYNTLDKPVPLSGWTLVYDKKRVIALESISIPPFSYVVLYDKDKEALSESNAYPVDNLYPLANSGDKLVTLLDARGKEIDECNYPKAKAGKSWEYSAEGWHLSSAERGGTPGEVNSERGIDNEEEEGPDEPEDDEPEKPDYPDPEAGEIILNELLPEPFAGGSEYIELLNRSERELSLQNVCISTRKKDGSLNTRYPLSDYEGPLLPGDYLLVSKSIADVEAFYTLPANVNCLECKLPALSNTGASVVLYRASDEEIIDEVTYSPQWHDESVKNRKGISLERIDPDGDSQDADNWASAASSYGSGTPGGQNSQRENDSEENVTGNEQISIPVYQPSGNYLITYRLDESGYSARGWIFDISGRRVATLVDNESLGTNGVLEWDGAGKDGSRLSPGIYIMYLELWNTSGSVYRKKSAFLVH